VLPGYFEMKILNRIRKITVNILPTT